MKIFGQTDIGKVRRENQDTFCAIKFSENEGFAVVCDGMGGANGGAFAANLACDTFKEIFLKMHEKCPRGDEKPFMIQAMEKANKKVFAAASSHDSLAGMGTTTVCVLVRDGLGFVTHVGDSRCYLLRGGKLTALTKDHSYVQGLIDIGEITKQEALQHPRRSAITRAIGADYSVDADFTSLTLVTGDIMLLCSDGLTRVLPEQIIEKIFTSYEFDKVTGKMIDIVNNAGGPDNTTVVILKIEAKEGAEIG